MTRLKQMILFGLLLLTFGVVAVPRAAEAQNTWGRFWDGMQTALVALETRPSQAYFDTLYDANLPNRDQVFQGLVAEANALTDMQVTYPIFIYENARAAYQRVVTGMFTQPYVAGSTTLPPTNTPVRWVTQGMMDANGAGQIYADYTVTDGFAKFQEFGAIPLAPGQEHGHIGLEPYAGEAEDAAFAPGASLFTRFARADRASLRRQADEDTEQWSYATVTEVARLLTVDENGNDATSTDFDPTRTVQVGFNFLNYSEPPVITLAASVTQDNWTAGYLTFATLPGTGINVDIFDAPLTAPDPIEFPAFAFLHTNEGDTIDLMIINYDLLGITNRLRINPTTIPLKGIDSPAQS